MVLVGALEGALEGREMNTGITKGQGKEGSSGRCKMVRFKMTQVNAS